jgi:hypothetical protein
MLLTRIIYRQLCMHPRSKEHNRRVVSEADLYRNISPSIGTRVYYVKGLFLTKTSKCSGDAEPIKLNRLIRIATNSDIGIILDKSTNYWGTGKSW